MDSQKLLNELGSKPKIKIPLLKVGMTLRVHQLISEGKKERVQVFEGLLIRIHRNGPNTTITVRKIASGVGVERIFLLSAPMIKKIEVIKIAKVRRAKLYYMRDLTGKAMRLKEVRVNISSEDIKDPEPPQEDGQEVAEEVEEMPKEEIEKKDMEENKEDKGDKDDKDDKDGDNEKESEDPKEETKS